MHAKHDASLEGEVPAQDEGEAIQTFALDCFVASCLVRIRVTFLAMTKTMVASA